MIFALGLVFGGASGGITYALTADSGVALLVGVAAAILTWLGVASIIFIDD